MAVDEDVLVGSASTFCSYNVGIVLFCYFVDDAYKAFVPTSLVVSWRLFGEKLGLFRGRGRGRSMAVFGICEAGFRVGQSDEVERHD